MAEQMDRPLMKRFEELACRADRQGVWTDTEFLTLAEQAVLLRMRLPVPVSLHGGYPDAERRLAAFGSEALFGFSYAPPIVCVRMAPAAERFADALTHRDFLGALMGLGVRREVMGDIRVEGSTGYLFCLRAHRALSDRFASRGQAHRHPLFGGPAAGDAHPTARALHAGRILGAARCARRGSVSSLARRWQDAGRAGARVAQRPPDAERRPDRSARLHRFRARHGAFLLRGA